MQKKGFTLIELLIVVTIIGILAVALVPRIVGGSAAARDSRRQVDLQNLAKGLEIYLSENGDFDDIWAGSGICSGAGAIETNLSPIIGAIPDDPNGTGTCGGNYWIYFLTDAGGTKNKFAIGARLESPEQGADQVYSAIPGDASYSTFTGNLDPYESTDANGFYIIY